MEDLSHKLKEYAALKRACESDASRNAFLTLGLYADGADTPSECEKEEMQQLSKEFEECNRLRLDLARWLLSSEAQIISDTTAHQIAHELRKELADAEVKAGWEGDWLPNILGRCFPEEYAARFVSIKPLVLLYEPAPNLQPLVTEAIRAYCLELPTAAVAIARSLVEAAVIDIAVKIERINDDAAIEKMRMCERISSLIDRSVSKTSPLRQGIDRFIATASKIIHGDNPADMAEARKHLEAAFSLTSQLYVHYRAQYLR